MFPQIDESRFLFGTQGRRLPVIGYYRENVCAALNSPLKLPVRTTIGQTRCQGNAHSAGEI